jgi:hypothetical protein
VRGLDRLAVGDRGIELGCVVDRVAVIDAVGHPDREWRDLGNQVIDLRSGFAGVQEHQQRRVISRFYSLRERASGHNHALVRLVLIVLKDDECFVAVTRKCTTWGRNFVIPSSKSAVVAAGRTSKSI